MSESDPKPYSYEVVRFLTEEEICGLSSTHWPKITSLSGQYVPEIDVSNGFPAKVEFLDLLRGRWMLERSDDKPTYDDVRDAVAFGLGRLLQRNLGMRWAIIRDCFGESTSLIWRSTEEASDYRKLSFPPFSYLEKRRGVENVEVCSDLYAWLKKKTKGEPGATDNPDSARSQAEKSSSN